MDRYLILRWDHLTFDFTEPFIFEICKSFIPVSYALQSLVAIKELVLPWMLHQPSSLEIPSLFTKATKVALISLDLVRFTDLSYHAMLVF